MGKKKTGKKTIMGAKVSENSDIPDDVKEAGENFSLELLPGKSRLTSQDSNDMGAGDPPPWQKVTWSSASKKKNIARSIFGGETCTVNCDSEVQAKLFCRL
jgi:hypothetical protein